MRTQCNRESFGFHALGKREVVGRFDGGQITSDGGGLLLRETEQATGIIAQFAGCFTDHRHLDQIEAQPLYEDEYCARGDMENRIKEQQLNLFADRTSASTMRANELRLWFSSLAYTLLNALRRLGLQGTDLAKAQCGTIRLKLLKIGAQIRVTVRKVWVSLAESYAYREVFHQVYERCASYARHLIGADAPRRQIDPLVHK